MKLIRLYRPSSIIGLISRQLHSSCSRNGGNAKPSTSQSELGCATLPSNVSVPHPNNWDPVELQKIVSNDCLVIQNFVSDCEEAAILKDVEPRFKRLRYEETHWDDAIILYRETEKRDWSGVSNEVIHRIRRLAFPIDSVHLSHVHVLDLHKDGYIKPHIDSVRFCGSTIAGVSLLSDAVMRLTHFSNPMKQLDLFLPSRSLYILRDLGRYDYKHEILPSGAIFKGKIVNKIRRISVICRSNPDPDKIEK